MIPAIDVHLSTGPGGVDTLVGRARFNLRHGSISTSFTYDESYLARPGALAIDPGMPLRSTFSFCDGLPGAFRDSSPDRWGRHLISRRFAAEAREASGPMRSLDEVDYLLGVHDGARQGALRFSRPGEGVRLSPEGSIPPVVELKRLLRASDGVARGSEDAGSVRELLDAGSGSLGGARPKATVLDDGRLFMAKFSHPDDEWDVMGWEKTALDLAAGAGIAVPSSRLVRLDAGSALVLERFDREGGRFDGKRLPYMSAMTLLGAKDGEQHDYLEVADALPTLCAHPSGELHELFRRIVFSIAIHNTDDHLRNIGFIYTAAGGWHLSPLFDVNPEFDAGRERATTIYGEAGEGEYGALAESVAYFGLGRGEARRIVEEVCAALMCWQAVAKRNGCPAREIPLLSPVLDGRVRALKGAFGL